MAPKYVPLPDVAGIYRTNRWDLTFHFNQDVSAHTFTLVLAEGATVLTPTIDQTDAGSPDFVVTAHLDAVDTTDIPEKVTLLEGALNAETDETWLTFTVPVTGPVA